MVSIRQIHPVFVGEVSGVDLRQPLTRDEVAAIEAGMDRYAVLIFHDQNITDDQQMERLSEHQPSWKLYPPLSRVKDGSDVVSAT